MRKTNKSTTNNCFGSVSAKTVFSLKKVLPSFQKTLDLLNSKVTLHTNTRASAIVCRSVKCPNNWNNEVDGMFQN